MRSPVIYLGSGPKDPAETIMSCRCGTEFRFRGFGELHRGELLFQVKCGLCGDDGYTVINGPAALVSSAGLRGGDPDVQRGYGNLRPRVKGNAMDDPKKQLEDAEDAHDEALEDVQDIEEEATEADDMGLREEAERVRRRMGG